MKKTLSLSLFLLAFTGVYAQPGKTSADFKKWTFTLDSNRYVASQAKDYTKCLGLIRNWISQYNQADLVVKKDFAGWNSSMYYNLACYYALTGQRPQALQSFDTAVKSGYSNYSNTLTDTDLNSLHGDPRFEASLQIMRNKYDYSFVLKQAGPYNAQNDNLPRFTYQDASNARLIAFKEKYKLDSVAGSGDEITRFKNLLAWVHDAVRHDGNSNNPLQVNGDSLITVCKVQNRGVNCRMMATILRDAYQAEGYKARIVTCMPRDTLDNDCHVIDVVWSDKQNKWIWMDPTFNAYLRDENGNYLNIEEVRQRLISGAPVVLNDDANWNHQNKETKEAYFNYMSKNLYWLKCSIKSEWDIETNKSGKTQIQYISLYPVGFNTMHAAKFANKWSLTYATNNPAYFWQKPQ